MTGRAFRLLWAGQTASVFGTAVSALAIPTIAIVTLHASPFAVGALGAVQFAAFPLLGLIAGVWVDRWSRRTTMLVADIARALALATVPIAGALHVVAFAQLVAVGACVGVASVFFEVAYQSIVPSLVDHDRLEGANARLEFSSSAAQIAGNGLAGGLIELVGAPLAVAIDACSYVVSAGALAAIRVREAHREGGGVQHAPFLRAMRDGLDVVFGSPVLRRLAGATATSNLGGSIVMAVYLLYAYRVLRLSPAIIGVIFAIANAGFAGAVFAPRIARRFGTGRTLIWSMCITTSMAFVLPLALIVQPIVVLLLVEIVITMGAPIYNITQVSLRQRLVPAEKLGRMSATMRTLVWGTLPIGMLIGGTLGNAIGIVPTIVTGACVGMCSVLWLLGDAIRTLPPAPLPVNERETDDNLKTQIAG